MIGRTTCAILFRGSITGAARGAAHAAGQAVAVADVAAHELGAAAYGIRAADDCCCSNHEFI
ncbi:putative immunity protein [Fontibacillus phaseoli]|uniref:putative immunity protein n=1 Tax=Fontibacillus phaseoli TaxID=1416533 RepID=UPI000DF1E3B6